MNVFLENFNFYSGQMTAVIIVGAGVYFTVKTRFFQFIHFDLIIKNTIGSLFDNIKRNKTNKLPEKAGLSSFQAFATSLGGTIGVGNIIGVSAAITAAGPGAVFWMWIAAFFGMTIKYCEIFLAVKYREKGRTPKDKTYNFAPMNYIIKGTGNKQLAFLFSVFGIICSFLIGNMAQSNAIAVSVPLPGDISPAVVGIFCCGLVAFLIMGGLKSLFGFIEKSVPIMCILYIIGSFVIIIINRFQILPAFANIFIGAFSPSSVLGGFGGAGIAAAIGQGISKGVFSNEAGMGSGALAHGSCIENPAEIQGLWGALEVFIDTVVVSGITALVVLTSGVWAQGGSNGVLTAFENIFGTAGGWFTAICIFLFAITSVVSWEYLGECCVYYVFKGKNSSVFILIYRILFVFFIMLGSVLNVEIIWVLAEITNMLMILTNMCGVFALKHEFFSETMRFFGLKAKHIGIKKCPE